MPGFLSAPIRCRAASPPARANRPTSASTGKAYQYFVSFSRGDQWQREPNALHKATRSEISRYFRDDAEQIDSALIRMAGGFGIFHFNKDATLNGKASDSDYMALMLIGAGPVYAVKCD